MVWVYLGDRQALLSTDKASLHSFFPTSFVNSYSGEKQQQNYILCFLPVDPKQGTESKDLIDGKYFLKL